MKSTIVTINLLSISLVITSLMNPLTSSIAHAQTAGKISGNELNPAISITLDGRYADLDSAEFELPGFPLGGEAGLPEQGFSTGHNELSMSANIDDKFYGSITTALVNHDGSTELELEEAYMETLRLGSGFTVKGGRFFSGFGYLNGIHAHAHDFADRPLVYDALFGGHLVDTGLQARWVAPVDHYVAFGAEVTTGSEFPGGSNEDNNKGLALFVKTGGDFGASSSWQIGASYYESEFDVREMGGHSHGHDEHEEHEEGEHEEGEHEEEVGVDVDTELHHGEVDVIGFDVVYKWAPNGNSKERNFKLQAEYLIKSETAEAEFAEGDETAEAEYDGEQSGFYVQAIYQFMPSWRVGLRYETIAADNQFANYESDAIEEEDFKEESGLGAEEDPERTTFMVDYSPSHFSKIRLQYSQFENGHHGESNDIVTLQYLMSLGSHGAHTF